MNPNPFPLSQYNRDVVLASRKGYRVTPEGVLLGVNGKPKKAQLHNGYFGFSIRRADRSFGHVKVHRLQAYQKYGEQAFAPALQVRHWDGNSQNNSAANLILGTPLENHYDKPEEVRVRTQQMASAAATKHNHPKVQAFFAGCRSYAQTMREFGISSKGTLHFILNNSKHLAPTL